MSICPIKSDALIKTNGTQCEKEDCAWWTELSGWEGKTPYTGRKLVKTGMCAIKKIAERL